MTSLDWNFAQLEVSQIDKDIRAQFEQARLTVITGEVIEVAKSLLLLSNDLLLPKVDRVHLTKGGLDLLTMNNLGSNSGTTLTLDLHNVRDALGL